jgi:Putative Ig domain
VRLQGHLAVLASAGLTSCCLTPVGQGPNGARPDAGPLETDAGGTTQQTCNGGNLYLVPIATDGGADGFRALLPSAMVDVPYSHRLGAVCGSSPYMFSLLWSEGFLPPGLRLRSDGEVSGTPVDYVRTGVFIFVVSVVDGAGSTAELRCEIEVPPTGPCDVGPLVFAGFTLPDVYVDQTWEEQLTAQGGCTPYHWSVTADPGGLPPGLQLSDSGYLSGIETEPGTWFFEVTVTDSAGTSFPGQFELTVLQ